MIIDMVLTIRLSKNFNDNDYDIDDNNITGYTVRTILFPEPTLNNG